MELTNCLLRRGASTGPCSVRICGSFARLTAPNFQQTLAIDCGIDTRHQGRFTEFHDAKSGMTLLVGTEHIPLERQLTELWVSLRGAGEYPIQTKPTRRMQAWFTAKTVLQYVVAVTTVLLPVELVANRVMERKLRAGHSG